MTTIRVLIADDHALVRAGFHALLSGIPGIEVVGEAGDGREAVQWVERDPPDVVLMDISMPGLNGLDAASRVVAEHPEVRVIVLSMHTDEEYVLQALRAGASGYLLKDSDAAELELALAAVVRGETYLSPQVSKHVIADYLRLVGAQPDTHEQLTPRQREVLQLIAEGHTTKEIAEILCVSVRTAMTHRAQLMERLDIHEVAGLVRYAIRIGLVSPDD
jgi:DNA-binding NarL/FixJ family response regulator